MDVPQQCGLENGWADTGQLLCTNVYNNFTLTAATGYLKIRHFQKNQNSTHSQ
jgi:hypothetical protein